MTESNKTVIVTGASGFIGSHLVKRLLNDGHSVIAITRSITSVYAGINNRLTWCEWDSIEEMLLSSEVSPIAIVHLATAFCRNETDYLEVEKANVLKPLRLLELATKYKIKKFINTDSYFSKKEFNYQYMRPYILTKNSFRQWGELISQSNEFQFVSMRLEHVYGPGDGNGKFIPYVLDAIFDKKENIKCTDCSQKRDFVYVDDVVSAYMVVINNIDVPLCKEYEVGVGHSIPLRLFVEELKRCASSQDIQIDFGAIPQRDNEILDSKADISALCALGWKPIYDFKQGVRAYLCGYIHDI